MSRLYGDLFQSAGKRFYFALDSVPGIVSPGVATLVLGGQVPIAVEPQTIFRTPAPAVLTLGGLMPGAPVVLSPAAATLSTVGQIPSRQLIRMITNALAPAVQNPPTPFAPTLITIWTTQPGVAQLSLQTLEINVTQGGNIGFVDPGPAHLTLGTLPFSLLLGGIVGAGQLNVVGLAPTLKYELTIRPDVGLVSLVPRAPELALPFTWVDDDPAPARTWLTDAAA